MVHRSKSSEDTLETRGDLDDRRPASVGALAPCLTLLACADFDRVGESAFDPAPEADGSILIGRKAPLFAPAGATQAGAPLDDPCVSREQAWLRWDLARRRWTVRPTDKARLPVAWAAPDAEARLRPLREATELPAGSLLALGDRALLRLGDAPRDDAGGRLGLLGASDAMATLRRRVLAVAGFDEPVLILGETGTGKELVARALHAARGARGGFVALNMAALDAGTAASELFGHVRGAFTGADQRRAGAFELARDGAVFLDEIGDLSLDLQKKLLRVLEDRRYAPLGSHELAPVTCRVVAATHRPLHDELGKGFRRDLYERLRALTVAVPPLRQRREDVPLLLAHFFRGLAARHPGLPSLLRPSAPQGDLPVSVGYVLSLVRRPWEGNVRELRNVATAAAAASLSAGAFRPGDSFDGTGAAAPRDEPAAPRGPAPIPEADAIERALSASRGNVKAAAEALGCTRFQLYRWMEARGVDAAKHRRDGGP